MNLQRIYCYKIHVYLSKFYSLIFTFLFYKETSLSVIFQVIIYCKAKMGKSPFPLVPQIAQGRYREKLEELQHVKLELETYAGLSSTWSAEASSSTTAASAGGVNPCQRQELLIIEIKLSKAIFGSKNLRSISLELTVSLRHIPRSRVNIHGHV